MQKETKNKSPLFRDFVQTIGLCFFAFFALLFAGLFVGFHNLLVYLSGLLKSQIGILKQKSHFREHKYLSFILFNLIISLFFFQGFLSTASAHTFSANGEAATQGTTVKFGSGAADYTGAGTDDYITAPDSADFLFDGDFTVEGWAYITANGSNGWIAAQSSSGQEAWTLATYGGGTNPGCYFAVNDGGVPWDYADFPNGTFPQNQWVHCAMARNGGTIIGCEDGTCTTILTGYTQSLTDSTASMTSGDQPAAADFVGYVDEVRVSKGIARYTGNFTPSSSAFTCDAQSVVLLHFDGNFTDSGAGGCAAAAVPLIINRPGVIFFDSDE